MPCVTASSRSPGASFRTGPEWNRPCPFPCRSPLPDRRKRERSRSQTGGRGVHGADRVVTEVAKGRRGPGNRDVEREGPAMLSGRRQ